MEPQCHICKKYHQEMLTYRGPAKQRPGKSQSADALESAYKESFSLTDLSDIAKFLLWFINYFCTILNSFYIMSK